MDRYTSMMISNVAQEYLEAAQTVRACNNITFRPTYFLACRSIELSLKAFLRGSGYSDDALVKIRHNLRKCLEKALAAEITKHVSLSDADAAYICAISDEYRSKDFEYTRSGYTEGRPHIDPLLDIADRLWNGLRDFCVARREHHFGKPTAITTRSNQAMERTADRPYA